MIDMYLVGGAVRDRLMGIEPHDYDFTVVAESYEAMKFELELMGLKIFQERPEFGTIRGRFEGPDVGQPVNPNALWFHDIKLEWLSGDFVWARKDGVYSDGRHPDTVEPGSLYDDLARRDFTVNAIAMDKNGIYIDPFEGRADIGARRLSAVGDPKERLLEDALRVVRAIRFSVVKGFWLDDELRAAMRNEAILLALRDNISTDRIRSELLQCFKHNTLETLILLESFSRLRWIIFGDNGGSHQLWLIPSEKRH